MACLGIERVALEVADLTEGVRRFGELFQTTFRVLTVAVPGAGTRRVAVSPLGVELVEVPSLSVPARLRSFHVRVDDLAAAAERARTLGAEVREAFTVGRMDHVAVAVEEALRFLFVAYDGDDGWRALIEG